MGNRTKHLEMIQGTINRMASNSFALKGWTVTLIAGVYVLSSKDAEKIYFVIAYIPIIIFWILDSYYLLQERLFRSLYNKVRKQKEDKIDFEMSTTGSEFKTPKNKYCACLFSKTEIGFYLPLVVLSTAIIIITMYSK